MSKSQHRFLNPCTLPASWRATCALLFIAGITASSLGRNAIAVDQRARGRNFYVAPKGSDLNPGTAGRPLRTIQRGVDLARPGDVILVRAGVYRESIRLSISGTPARPISLKNYPHERPVIAVDKIPTTDIARKGILLQSKKGEKYPISWWLIQGFEIRNAYDGIKLYNGDHLILLSNKIVDSSGQGILGNGHHIVIRGNIIARNGFKKGDPGSTQRHGIYLTGNQVMVSKNVFYQNQAYAIQVAGYSKEDKPYYASDEYGGAEEWVIRNNTFAFHKVRGPIVLWQADTKRCVIEDNIFYGNAKPDVTDYTPKDSQHVIRGNFSGDPNFVDPEHFDFHLRPDSPALGKGAFPEPAKSSADE